MLDKLQELRDNNKKRRELSAVAALTHPKLESRRSSFGTFGSQIQQLVTPFETDPLAVENEINDRLGDPNNTAGGAEEWTVPNSSANTNGTPIANPITDDGPIPDLIDPVRPDPVANGTSNTTEEKVTNTTLNITSAELMAWKADQMALDESFEGVDALLQGFRYHQTLKSTLKCSRNLH